MIKVKVKIQLDFDDLNKELEALIEEGMEELMNSAKREWELVAKKKLHSTRRDYQDAIQTKKIDPMTVHLYLDNRDSRKNWLVNALEAGHGPMLPWRSTLAGKTAFYWSGEGSKHGYKGGEIFTDVPQRHRSTPKEGGTPGGVDKGKNVGAKYLRLTKNNTGMWTHRGFKPLGAGGLDRPLREYVVEFVEEEAPKMFNRLMSKIKI
jgi:hypothetical protein